MSKTRTVRLSNCPNLLSLQDAELNHCTITSSKSIWSYFGTVGVLLFILFIVPIVSLFTLSTLFTEPVVDKAQAKRLEESSRSHRNCRHIYSLLDGTAAIPKFSPLMADPTNTAMR